MKDISLLLDILDKDEAKSIFENKINEGILRGEIADLSTFSTSFEVLFEEEFKTQDTIEKSLFNLKLENQYNFLRSIKNLSNELKNHPNPLDHLRSVLSIIIPGKLHKL